VKFDGGGPSTNSVKRTCSMKQTTMLESSSSHYNMGEKKLLPVFLTSEFPQNINSS
jgi:hypothetical protein